LHRALLHPLDQIALRFVEAFAGFIIIFLTPDTGRVVVAAGPLAQDIGFFAQPRLGLCRLGAQTGFRRGRPSAC
jgi:hypothetical protein